MGPQEILTATNAAITLIEALLPSITALVQKGEITPAQQTALMAKYQSLKTKADGQFAGPEWQVV